MPTQTREVSPGPTARTVRTDDGHVLTVPPDWVLLPPGDAGLSRRVKAAGPTGPVREKVGRKIFSRGVWTPPGPVDAARAALAAERSTPAYAARRERDQRRREQ